MARTLISSARSSLTQARSALTSARTDISVYRTPLIFNELGFTNGWDFRNGKTGLNGTDIPDIIGKLNLLARNITEGTFYTAGEYKGTFDGNNDICQTGIDVAETPTTAFSAIIAIKRTVSGANAGIFGQWRTNLNRCWLLRTASNNPAGLQFYISTNGSANTAILTSTDAMIANDAWVIIGVTYDGATTAVKIYYLNSSGFSETTYSTVGAIPASLFSATTALSIGAYLNGAGVVQEPFTGEIGMSLLNKTTAISSAQMQTVMTVINELGGYI